MVVVVTSREMARRDASCREPLLTVPGDRSAQPLGVGARAASAANELRDTQDGRDPCSRVANPDGISRARAGISGGRARARAFGSRRRDHPMRLGHYSRRVATLLHDAIAVLGAQRRGQTVDKSTRSGERRTTRQGLLEARCKANALRITHAGGRSSSLVVLANRYSSSVSVRGHEKVPTGGQVRVPTGGQIEVPTLRVVS